MAKMLGQDIFTQEEFDAFKQQHHDPLVSITDTALKLNSNALKVAKYAMIASAASLLGTLALAVLIVLH